MTVEHMEVLVEEPSMEEALRLLLPRILSRVSFDIHPHQCKEDLLKRLPERLRAYRRWLPEHWRIVILVDLDKDDCHELKARLEKYAHDAGFMTRTGARAEASAYVVVNRIIIEEREAWYFGDWPAVRAAYPRLSPTVPRQASFRDPDSIPGGTWEAFERLLQRKGYFSGGLRKIDAARSIVPHMDPNRNNSHGFQVFREALREIVAS